ncbi:hypothetical protein J18TS1_20930 [Oceanobacillus oncorhynchi subsp. incaldanensis]|uniref:HTH domain-containing protein n=1 Tax=Oceanobacillus aidingensis TaxID=645964 RepID=A0ABV9JTL7_9BACI|nr:hypothetical protein [Oceanobacillus oncorhynchi]MDM8101023.1 hypothetical protein [Oceanobacillus oncorhynchi]GIO18993.1 hypothetical protein J18TS1_20930 [Oceanobacillus oncorhynchi subsp. incaldanensis]
MIQLDERGNKILKELMINPNITSKDVEKKYDLTRRQLGYSFEKLNDWLKSKNYPIIERTSQGNFIIDKTIIKK